MEGKIIEICSLVNVRIRQIGVDHGVGEVDTEDREPGMGIAIGAWDLLPVAFLSMRLAHSPNLQSQCVLIPIFSQLLGVSYIVHEKLLLV